MEEITSHHAKVSQSILEQCEKDITDINRSDLPMDLKCAQRYKVAQIAFDDLMEETTTYRSLLKSIKLSYDEYIKIREESTNSSIALSTKLKNMAARPATFVNLKKRSDEMEKNVEYLRAENEKLKSRIEQATNDNRKAAEEKVQKRKEEVHREKTWARHVGKTSVEETLNEEKMRLRLKKAKQELSSLEKKKVEGFISKERHEELWRDYNKVSEQKTVLENTFSDLQKEHYLIKTANTAAEAFLEREPLGKTISEHVYESIVDAFKKSVQDENFFDSSESSKDSGLEGQGDVISHVEHFHILLEESRFEQAAFHAAQSPKGVLRNKETYKKLKEFDQMNPDQNIVYTYARAFMGSMGGTELGRDRDRARLPDQEMSLGFVGAAIRAGDEKAVYHWFQNGWLHSSKEVADLLACNRHTKVHGTVVAEDIYMRLGLHHDAIKCMAYRGDIPAAISFAQDTAKFDRQDYTDLLMSVPSVNLAKALANQKYPNTNEVLIPCGQIALLLLKDINFGVAGDYLKTLDLEIPLDDSEISTNNIFSDSETTEEDWLHVAKQLENSKYEDLGAEIIAAVTSRTALKNALADF